MVENKPFVLSCLKVFTPRIQLLQYVYYIQIQIAVRRFSFHLCDEYLSRFLGELCYLRVVEDDVIDGYMTELTADVIDWNLECAVVLLRSARVRKLMSSPKGHRYGTNGYFRFDNQGSILLGVQSALHLLTLTH